MRTCLNCKRPYNPSARTQKYCSTSCRNCAASAKKLAHESDESLIQISPYYLGEQGLREVLNGHHDVTLAEYGLTREQWIKKRSEKKLLWEGAKQKQLCSDDSVSITQTELRSIVSLLELLPEIAKVDNRLTLNTSDYALISSLKLKTKYGG